MLQDATRLPFEIDIAVELFRQLGVVQVIDDQVRINSASGACGRRTSWRCWWPRESRATTTCQGLATLREDRVLATLLGC